jgi:hypothetical protein
MVRAAIRVAVFGCMLTAGCGSNDDLPAGEDAAVTDAADNQDSGVVDSGVTPITCDPAFSEADACGGNLEGSWSYSTLCGPTPAQTAVLELCPDAVINSERLDDATGTLNVSAGLFALSVAGNGILQVTFPPACVPLNSCIVLGIGINAALSDALGEGASATCTTASPTPGCACELRAPVEVTTAGPVATNGGIAEVTVSPDSVRTFYYCVDGDNLTVRGFGTTDNEPTVVLERP